MKKQNSTKLDLHIRQFNNKYRMRMTLQDDETYRINITRDGGPSFSFSSIFYFCDPLQISDCIINGDWVKLDRIFAKEEISLIQVFEKK